MKTLRKKLRELEKKNKELCIEIMVNQEILEAPWEIEENKIQFQK